MTPTPTNKACRLVSNLATSLLVTGVQERSRPEEICCNRIALNQGFQTRPLAASRPLDALCPAGPGRRLGGPSETCSVDPALFPRTAKGGCTNLPDGGNSSTDQVAIQRNVLFGNGIDGVPTVDSS